MAPGGRGGYICRMTFREFQALIRRTYGRRDRRRGTDRNTLWFVEEVGEFAEAVRKRSRREMAAEAADVVAWLTSVCDLEGIDLQDAVARKYGRGCPACRQQPCRCPGK